MATAEISWLQAAPGTRADVSWLQAAPAGTQAQMSWLQAAPGARTYSMALLPGSFMWQGAGSVSDHEVDLGAGVFTTVARDAELTYVPNKPAVPARLTLRRVMALGYTPRRRPPT